MRSKNNYIMGQAGLDLIYANLNWQYNDPVNDVYLFQNAFEELFFLQDISYPLNPINNAQTDAFEWLKTHPTESQLILQHYNANMNGMKIKETHKNAIEYLTNIVSAQKA